MYACVYIETTQIWAHTFRTEQEKLSIPAEWVPLEKTAFRGGDQEKWLKSP